MPPTPKSLLKARALELGFDAFGVAAAGRLEDSLARFDHWLEQGYHGSMGYMERNRDKRLDPRELLEGARSVVVVAMNYYPESLTENGDPADGHWLKVAKYAWGRDYHYVIREKLNELGQFLEQIAPGSHSRGFTDSAPVLERSWAVRAGVGWTGKNACLIIPRKGSFFFLGELITTAVLEPDKPFGNDLCGSCMRCMEACPTKAITAPGTIDARRCISYLTIESKDAIPREFRKQCRGWIFGCDICQDVCPHNRRAGPTREPQFAPLQPMGWEDHRWASIQKGEFRKLLVRAGSPLSRVRYDKLTDNIRAGMEAGERNGNENGRQA